MLTYLKNFVWGIALALGGILPGVGLQTTAVIVGLYDDVLDFFYQITEYFKTIGKFVFGKAQKGEISTSFHAIKWAFGLPVFIGVALTLFALSHPVSALLNNYSYQIVAISFGIVLASILVPFQELSQKTWREITLFITTFVAFFALFSIVPSENITEPPLLLFLAGGFLASFATLLPGISVRFTLTSLGIAASTNSAITSFVLGKPTLFSFLALVLFVIGFLGGFVLFTRLISYLIKSYKSLFLAFLMGVLAASLRLLWPFMLVPSSEKILPWQESLPQFTQQLILITIAFVLVSIVRKFAENKGTLASSFGPKERTIIN